MQDDGGARQEIFPKFTFLPCFTLSDCVEFAVYISIGVWEERRPLSIPELYSKPNRTSSVPNSEIPSTLKN
jgi:hypothetical protein